MLLNQVPGPAWLYPIFCSAIDGPDDKVWIDVIMPAYGIRLYSHPGYLFTFAGCQWVYIVSSQAIPRIEKICLTEKGELPIDRRESVVLDRHREEFHRRREGL